MDSGRNIDFWRHALRALETLQGGGSCAPRGRIGMGTPPDRTGQVGQAGLSIPQARSALTE